MLSNLFNKEKGKSWQLFNLFFVFFIISCFLNLFNILFCHHTGVIFSSFNSTNEIIILLLAIILSVVIIYIINYKINLFDKTYAFSRKLINAFDIYILFCYILTIISFFLIVEEPLKHFGDIAKISIIVCVPIIASLLVINKLPICLRRNSKGLNFINYISVEISQCALIAILATILYISSFTYVVDAIRVLLLELVLLVIFALAIYYLNFKKIKKETK